MNVEKAYSKDVTAEIYEVTSDLANKLKNPEAVESAVMEEKNTTMLGNINPWDPISLSHGFPGTILFFSEMNRLYSGERWDYIVHDHILYVSRYIQGGIRSISLFGGATGLAFSVHSASQNGKRYQKLLTNLDNMILEETLEEIKKEKHRDDLGSSPAFYDIIQGFSGVGRYLLERNEQKPVFDEVLKSLLNAFINMSHPIQWQSKEIPGWYISRENQFLEKDKTEYPQGNFNVGLAHGILGPLCFMSLCIMKGIEVPRQRQTMNVISDWLIKQMKKDSNGFPIWPHRLSLEEVLNNENYIYNEREGWCYGNPGVARILYLAGKAINKKEYQEIAIKGFLGTIKRPLRQLELESPTFCHGKAGLLQILLRMRRDTKNQQFDPYIYSLAGKIVKDFNFDSPLGFEDIEIYGENRNSIHKAGLLEGCTGTGLTLLSLISDQEPYWDLPFLIS